MKGLDILLMMPKGKRKVSFKKGDKFDIVSGESTPPSTVDELTLGEKSNLLEFKCSLDNMY